MTKNIIVRFLKHLIGLVPWPLPCRACYSDQPPSQWRTLLMSHLNFHWHIVTKEAVNTILRLILIWLFCSFCWQLVFQFCNQECDPLVHQIKRTCFFQWSSSNILMWALVNLVIGILLLSLKVSSAYRSTYAEKTFESLKHMISVEPQEPNTSSSHLRNSNGCPTLSSTTIHKKVSGTQAAALDNVKDSFVPWFCMLTP